MVNTGFLNKTEVKPPLTTARAGEYLRCYNAKVTDNGIWQEVNPLAQALPIFVLQLILITSITRFSLLLLKPLRQPLIVAELLAGFILGNSGLQTLRNTVPFVHAVFALPRVLLLETFGNLGIIYYLFLHGLEMDLTTIKQIGHKPIAIAVAGTIIPFIISFPLYFLSVSDAKSFPSGYLLWGVSLSVTGLPVLTDILVNLKLLHSDFGRTAMSAALLNDIISWILLIVVVVITTSGEFIVWTMLSTFVFIIFSIYVIRPIILWIIRRTREGEDYSEATVCIILTGVLACGMVTDFLGSTSLVGAFVFGLIIPSEVVGQRFVVVLQGFVSDLLMPVYFTLCGFRTYVSVLKTGAALWVVGLTICVAFVCKLGTTLGVSYFFGTPVREAMPLALLMNTKSVCAIVALILGRDSLVIDDTGFFIMIVSIMLMTMATSPILRFLYKPTRMRFLPSKHRSLQKLKPDTELRILVCVHEMQTVAGIINLLEVSNATKSSPICVFALQLIQLTKNATALLIVHGPCRTGSQNSRSRADAQTEQMIEAFEKFEEESTASSVQPLTAMSSYETMHEDICSVAEEKRVTLIIVPFHKRQTIHNKMEDTNLAYKDVNDNVFANSPCSVAILVDRWSRTSVPMDTDSNDTKDGMRHIAMIYIGGPDDREALAYAWRMGGNPKATLTVVRFIPSGRVEDVEPMVFMEETDGALSVTIDAETERQLDDYYINEFRHKTATDKSIVLSEKVVNNGAETVGTIRSMGENFDLYVVGRGLGMVSPLTAGLADWTECPELGAIGDLLMTSDFSSTASVLVVQQYAGLKPTRDGSATPDSSVDFNGSYHLNRRTESY